jgi:hypothetical protein
MFQAARSHYCVHSGVSKKANVDEECDKLLEERLCKYFINMPKLLGLQNTSVLQVPSIDCLYSYPIMEKKEGARSDRGYVLLPKYAFLNFSNGIC